MLAQTASRNLLLAALAPPDFALLQPDLETMDLPVRRQLELRNRPIEFVYFLHSGLASMVVSAGANHNIEVGIVGSEGMTGLAILLESERPWCETFIQTAGTAWRLPAESLRAAMAQSHPLRRVLLRYANFLVSQMAYTALANGRYKIEERLARWLLMADDRADGNAIHLTHEFLALMLGARRAGVTNALSEFQRRGVLRVKRGVIGILDRGGLEEAANGSYGVPEAEYQRLFGQVI
ncbi:MAG TPA: Crp/Fnr family transcriptional regulator [Rhizomicrobium sp.]|nr:Crp/Fnr family transcriptional regulator [Rhizomicrobium sp.]